MGNEKKTTHIFIKYGSIHQNICMLFEWHMGWDLREPCTYVLIKFKIINL